MVPPQKPVLLPRASPLWYTSSNFCFFHLALCDCLKHYLSDFWLSFSVIFPSPPPSFQDIGYRFGIQKSLKENDYTKCRLTSFSSVLDYECSDFCCFFNSLMPPYFSIFYPTSLVCLCGRFVWSTIAEVIYKSFEIFFTYSHLAGHESEINRLNDFPKVTCLIKCRTRIWTRFSFSSLLKTP